MLILKLLAISTLSSSRKALFLFIAVFFIKSSICKAKSHFLEADFSYQAQQALSYLLENILSSEVSPGAVMASPSKTDPTYFYHWVRDAAITMNIFVDYLEFGEREDQERAFRILKNWIFYEEKLQRLNVSAGLGEPKYNLDGSAFTGPWGRPQTDGPALRAKVMIRMAKLLIKRGNLDYVKSNLWCFDCPIIRDLQYLLENWKSSSFDLWEEVFGDHFYTHMAHMRAFHDGAELAERMSDFESRDLLIQMQTQVYNKLFNYIDSGQNLIQPTINRIGDGKNKTSGLDVAVLLGFLHSRISGEYFDFNNFFLRSSIQKLENIFVNIYPINYKKAQIGRTAIGRYPEDVYDGVGMSSGNPWFISTNAYAEFYCSINQKQDGLDFLERSIFHAARNGHLSEQFNRNNGYMQGARDLTWSYASYLSAYLACFSKLPKLGKR